MIVTEALVESDVVDLPGTLAVPEQSRGVVVFAHGSGSSRLSRRNLSVAETLNDGGCATLLFDLLTEDESHDRVNVFDIALLARRVRRATSWIRAQPSLLGLPIGYFGASTGAAAALVAAATPGTNVTAIVSRGGRPDLAGDALAAVQAPTLLLVGSRDGVVLDLNRRAQTQLRCESELVVVDGASHLFEEPGTLETVAREATDWFTRHFG